MVTTPVSITRNVFDFCHEVAPATLPVYLPVRPVRGAQALDAFDNVLRFTRLSGGTPQYGWLIWEWPGAFIEAEHHCVVRQLDGSLRDVTPHDETRVLFLPDDTATFDMKTDTFARPSIRKALTPDPLVEEYLALFNARDHFIRSKMTLGLNVLTPADIAEVERFESESMRLSAELFRRELKKRGHRGFVSHMPAA